MTVGGRSRPGPGRTPLRVANCSGFFGDRLSALREVLEGGPVDIVTGDYLAELTMLILGRQRRKDPQAGWVRSFLVQLEDCLGLALERGVRIVSNAGGLHPRGLAAAVTELAGRLGLDVAVATVGGDDLTGRWADLVRDGAVVAGESGPRPGEPPPADVLTANAYLGCWGIARALDAGAQVVLTGRVTDASLVVGAAAHHHGWTPGDLDSLAGGTVAGHVLECGPQATGGNFSLFLDLLDAPGAPPDLLDRPGFPLAEVAADGSCVVTKHPGTGGAVTVGTVTEQLLYECTGALYGGPDVLTRFDGLRLVQDGPDRVGVSGARGLPPTGWLKVATNRVGGWRNGLTVPLTGLHVERKAELLRRQLAPALAAAGEAHVVLARTDTPDAGAEEPASALLRVVVRDSDPDRVGRAFTAPLVELGLASIPGFSVTTPPGPATPYGVYAAAWTSAALVPQVVTHADGTVEQVAAAGPTGAWPRLDPVQPPRLAAPSATRRVPLGRVAGARAGDKGGTCTLGVYGRDDAAYAWLAGTLTTERLVQLLPEAAGLPVERELLPGLLAVLFQVRGLLGEGVAAGVRFDPQGKGVGEWLRSRLVDVPEALLD